MKNYIFRFNNYNGIVVFNDGEVLLFSLNA